LKIEDSGEILIPLPSLHNIPLTDDPWGHAPPKGRFNLPQTFDGLQGFLSQSFSDWSPWAKSTLFSLDFVHHISPLQAFPLQIKGFKLRVGF
jgi:hypothetical protein